MGPRPDRWTAKVLASILGALFVLLASVVEIADSMPGDERLLTELDASIGTRFDDAMVAVGTATDSIPMIAASGVVVAILAIRTRPRDVATYLAIVVVAVAGNRVLKEIVARPRPDIRPHPSSVSEFAFPSGHAANTMALWTGLLLIVRSRRLHLTVLMVGGAAVILVGFSRLASGVHYPSDVLAGWLWVGAWATLVSSSPLTRRRGDTSR